MRRDRETIDRRWDVALEVAGFDLWDVGKVGLISDGFIRVGFWID